MSNTEIKFYNKIVGTDAVPILVKAWGDLIDLHYAEQGSVLIQWDHKAFVLYNSEQYPIGVLSFMHTDWNDQFHIILGYVRPTYRGAGHYTKLWEALVEKAKTDKISKIYSATSVNNIKMNTLAIEQGREHFGNMFIFDVPKK